MRARRATSSSFAFKIFFCRQDPALKLAGVLRDALGAAKPGQTLLLIMTTHPALESLAAPAIAPTSPCLASMSAPERARAAAATSLSPSVTQPPLTPRGAPGVGWGTYGGSRGGPTAKSARFRNKRGEMNIKRGHFWTKLAKFGRNRRNSAVLSRKRQFFADRQTETFQRSRLRCGRNGRGDRLRIDCGVVATRSKSTAAVLNRDGGGDVESEDERVAIGK